MVGPLSFDAQKWNPTYLLQALANAKKDNDLIYHDKVPDINSLPLIDKAPVAKPLPMPEKMSSNCTGKFTMRHTTGSILITGRPEFNPKAYNMILGHAHPHWMIMHKPLCAIQRGLSCRLEPSPLLFIM